MTTRQSIALILSPLGLLIISAGRLIIVANFNTTTAVTIASNGGFVNTLLGSVIPMVPLFVPYLALLLLLLRRFLLSIVAFGFAAFISPTSITLTQGLSFARSDWRNLVAKVTTYQAFAVTIAIMLLLIAWAYNRSLLEALSILLAGAAAAAVLVSLPIGGAPGPLHLASNDVSSLESRASSLAGRLSSGDLIGFLVISVLIFAGLVYGSDQLTSNFGGFTGLVIAAIAIVATIALFPYIHHIYPIPQHRNYYAEATHAMWLPDERIVLNNHRIYYGYVLSSDNAWFTVLLTKSRTIAYIPAGAVVERSVCQPGPTGQATQDPPLIPWLYNRPSSLPACAVRDVAMESQAQIRSVFPAKAETEVRKPPADLATAEDGS